MKTLLHILIDKDAGVASVVRNLCRYSTDNFKLKIILLHQKNADNSFRIKDDLNAHEVIRLEFVGRSFGIKYNIIKKIRKEIDKDTILISHDGGIELDVIRYYNLKIPTVYILHGDYNHYYNVLINKKEAIGTIITVSDYLSKKTKKIINNIPIYSLKFPVPFVEKFKRKESTTIRLVFVGSLIVHKGIFTLSKIVELLVIRNIDFKLNIIGDGIMASELKSELSRYENVSFLGKLSNDKVMESHQNNDIILLPSFNEGLPVVLVEAMKCGVVPMATNLKTGIPEIIEHEVNGFQVPVKDAKKYVNYISTLYNNPTLLSKMREACIQKANLMFDPNEQTLAFEKIFNQAKSVNAKIPSHKKISYFLPFNLLRNFNRLKGSFKNLLRKKF